MDYTMGWNPGQGIWYLRVVILYDSIDGYFAKHERKILGKIREWLAQNSS
jgi:hypothetical protein